MNKLTIDFETRSAAPLLKCGSAVYARDPSTDAICLALKEHGKNPVIWFNPKFLTMNQARNFDLPVIDDAEVVRLLDAADIIEAHNASFELDIWQSVMPRCGFKPFTSVCRFRCSAAKAAMHGLPRSLDGACSALGVPQQKDLEGSRLMQKLCKPRAAHKVEMLSDPDWEKKTYWNGTPEDFAREGKYCLQDVRAEEALSDAISDLPAPEVEVWTLDREINERGIRVDVPAVLSILECIDDHSSELLKEFKAATGLSSPRQRDATLNYLLSLGVQMDSLNKEAVESTLEITEDEKAKRILEIRQSLSKSSTAKYKAFLASKCPDDRVRGAFVYHGAGTGRWTGKLVQPQNFPRGEFSGDLDIDWCIQLFKEQDLQSIRMFFGDPMAAAATCLRGMMIPSDGYDFICADYSSIEGRVLAWLAGEESALNVYRENRDPYKVNASFLFHVDYNAVDKAKRQVGKVMELACIAEGELVLTDRGLVPIEKVTKEHLVWDGENFVFHDGVVCRGEKEVIYYDGLTATSDHLVFVEGTDFPIYFGLAASRGARLLRFGNIGKKDRTREDYIRGEAEKLARHPRKARVYDILNAGPNHRFVVSGVIVHNCGYQGGKGAFARFGATFGVKLPEDKTKSAIDSWRSLRPETVRFWKEVENAASLAIRHPGTVYSYRMIKFVVSGKFLMIRLPSGRCLYYANPRFESKTMKWGEDKWVIAFSGVDSVTRKWGTQYLYGGLITENITQAVARDILVFGMFNVSETGIYFPVLHVHDELCSEVKQGVGSVEEYEKLMSTMPEWASDLPMKAEGWRGNRYKK